ncbi:TPA: phage tail fiber protein [Pseudomonas aeruginosa]
MTVPTNTSVVEYEGNGVTTAFPVPFKFPANGDLVVTKVYNDVSTVLSLGTDYSVVGAGAQAGGAVITNSAPQSGSVINISRELEPVQETDLRNQGRYFAETHESVFDYLTMLIQQSFSGLSRALRRPVGKDYFDAENRRIARVADPVEDMDAANRLWTQQYVGSVINSGTGPVNLASNVIYIGPNGAPYTVQDISDDSDPSKGADLIGFEGRTVRDKLMELVSLADKGGVPDYQGTPLYDGNDGSRITATDNTAAFSALITEAISRGDACVHIPAGHWGIKVGQLNFSNFEKISIVGDGMDTTIIDFIHEYAPVTGGGYVTNDIAHAIAKFASGDSIEFSNLTIKGTTKKGLVTGAPGSNWTYEGAVWGFILQNVNRIRLDRVRVEHFNYRGFSMYGSETKEVIINECEGFYNVGSGFWVEDTDSMLVTGGEFAYNGISGEVGTGYGVTGSTRVGNMVVNGGYYHHNYRKGLDTHGVHHFKLLGGLFQANIYSHCDVLRYSTDPTGCTTQFKGATFTSGIDPDEQSWILAEYNLRKTNGYTFAGGHVFRVIDNSAGKSSSVHVSEITVRGHYAPKRTVGFTEGGPVPFQFSTTLGRLSWIGNEIDLTGYEFSASGTFGTHCLFEGLAAEFEFKDGLLNCPADGSFTNTTTGLSDKGNVFILQGVSTYTSRVSFDNWRVRVNNLYLSSAASSVGTGATRQSINWANTGRIVTNCSFGWATEPYTALAPLERFNNIHFLGAWQAGPLNSSLSYLKNNYVITGGRTYALPDDSLAILNSRKPYSFPNVTKALGAQVFSIVMDKQSGSLVKISTGLSGEELNISVYSGDFTGISGSGSNPYLEFDSADPNYLVNGVAKLRLNVKAKIALNNINLFGEIWAYGRYPSLGIEYVFAT